MKFYAAKTHTEYQIEINIDTPPVLQESSILVGLPAIGYLGCVGIRVVHVTGKLRELVRILPVLRHEWFFIKN